MNNQQPIYSIDLSKDEHIDLRNYVPRIIAQENVNMLNNIISIVPHGIFVFMQYQEKAFIVNGYTEQLFWNNVIRLYSLLHDCGQKTLGLFIQPRAVGGREALNIFQSGEGIENTRFVVATSFIEDIKALRHFEAHNFKPDSKTDQLKIVQCKRWFVKVCEEEHPSNQTKWTRCNRYLVKVADEIFKILCARLGYFENHCSEIQKECLLNAYYEKCNLNLALMIFKAFQDINKQHRLNMNITQINARIQRNGEQLLKDAVKLIQGASRNVDPYKALVETITISIVRR